MRLTINILSLESSILRIAPPLIQSKLCLCSHGEQSKFLLALSWWATVQVHLFQMLFQISLWLHSALTRDSTYFPCGSSFSTLLSLLSLSNGKVQYVKSKTINRIWRKKHKIWVLSSWCQCFALWKLVFQAANPSPSRCIAHSSVNHQHSQGSPNSKVKTAS